MLCMLSKNIKIAYFKYLNFPLEKFSSFFGVTLVLILQQFFGDNLTFNLHEQGSAREISLLQENRLGSSHLSDSAMSIFLLISHFMMIFDKTHPYSDSFRVLIYILLKEILTKRLHDGNLIKKFTFSHLMHGENLLGIL